MTGWRGHGLRIGTATAVGLVVGLPAALFAPPTIATALGWDAGALAYAVGAWLRLRAVPAETFKAWSAEEDEGRATITLILTAASAVSVLSIFAMVTDKSSAAVLALAAVTILCSWGLVHTVFAVHYAHACYAAGSDAPAIDFPGDEPPVFDDFAYYAFVVGMTFQVSDCATRSTAMRRLTLVHGVVSFVFNTVIIAISVGVASGML